MSTSKGNQIATNNKIKDGSTTVDVIVYILAGIICFITIYPMYYVIIRSISDPLESLAKNVTFYPRGLYFGTYKLIVSDTQMWRAYFNTIIYVLAGTGLMLLTSVMAAYPLVSTKLIGRKWVVRFLLVPMYFSGGMIPSFILMNKLNLYDNRLAMILPGAVGIMNIILTRTYFTTIPTSLSESAEIDGANIYQILYRIFIPLSKPILAVVAIYTIVSIWNSWFAAMIYLPSSDKHPLQMYLQRLLIAQTIDINELKTQEELIAAQEAALSATQMKYAMIVFITMPIIFVYPLFQKHFIKGIMLGSLKG